MQNLNHLNKPAAQHGIAVGRFAREIARILALTSGALAATECQPVSRLFLPYSNVIVSGYKGKNTMSYTLTPLSQEYLEPAVELFIKNYKQEQEQRSVSMEGTASTGRP